MPNPYAQFDEPAEGKNPYAQFDPPVEKGRSDEPPDILYKPIAAAARAIPGALERAGKHAKELMTGEAPPTPENVLPAASIAIGASPIRLGLGGPKAAVAPAPIAAPVAAAPPTARTLGELKEAGLEAMLQPTGTVVAQPRAGEVIRQAITPKTPPRVANVDDWMTQAGGPAPGRRPADLDEWIYQAKAGTPSEEWIRRARTPGDDWTAGLPRVSKAPEAPAAIEAVPASVRSLFPGEGKEIMGHLLDIASGKVEGGFSALGQVRKAVPAEDWAVVQGATLARMGGAAGAKGPAGFDPLAMIREYKAMPNEGKGILFGESGKAGLRTHLNSLADDLVKIEGLSTKGAGTPQPLDILGSLLQQGRYGTVGHALLRHLTSPSTAASIAAWSRALTRVIEKGKTPAAIAALTIATRNLENTIGSAQAGEPQRLTDDEKAFAETTRGISGLGFNLPFEKMRQSKNVEMPEVSNASDLYIRPPPNSEYLRLLNLPPDKMAIDAGALDVAQSKMLSNRADNLLRRLLGGR